MGEVQVNTPPGGNGFNLKLSENKMLGITGPVVVPALCLLLVAALGWIRSKDLKDSLATVNMHLQKLYDRQDAHRSELQTLMLTQLDQLRSQVRAQTELMNSEGEQVRAALRENREVTGQRLQEQNHLLDAQTAQLATNQTGITDAMRQQTAQLRTWLATVIFKLENPEQPVSLDLPLPPQDKHLR